MKLVETLRRQWERALDKRTGRERVALAIMLVTIAGAIWVQLLWSAHHARARYAVLIAELQTHNDAMRQAAASMLAAKAQGIAIRPIGAEKALTAFADGLRGAGVAGLAVLPDAQGKVRLSGNAEFDAWIAWLAKTHADYGAQVLASIDRADRASGHGKDRSDLALPEIR
jgi:hypothetical protein